jgi:hypothetical protein
MLCSREYINDSLIKITKLIQINTRPHLSFRSKNIVGAEFFCGILYRFQNIGAD